MTTQKPAIRIEPMDARDIRGTCNIRRCQQPDAYKLVIDNGTFESVTRLCVEHANLGAMSGLCEGCGRPVQMCNNEGGHADGHSNLANYLPPDVGAETREFWTVRDWRPGRLLGGMLTSHPTMAEMVRSIQREAVGGGLERVEDEHITIHTTTREALADVQARMFELATAIDAITASAAEFVS